MALRFPVSTSSPLFSRGSFLFLSDCEAYNYRTLPALLRRSKSSYSLKTQSSFPPQSVQDWHMISSSHSSPIGTHWYRYWSSLSITCPTKTHSNVNKHHGNTIYLRHTIQKCESNFTMKTKTCNQVGDIPYAVWFSEEIVAGKINGGGETYVYMAALSIKTTNAC